MRMSLKHLGALWMFIVSIMLSAHVRSYAAEMPTLGSIEIAEWVRLSDSSGKALVKFNITNPVDGSRIDDLHIVKFGGQEATTARLNGVDASSSPVVVELDLAGLNSNGKTSLYVKGQYRDKDGNIIRYLDTKDGKGCFDGQEGTQCGHGYSFDHNIGEVSTAMADFTKSAILGGNFRRFYKEGKEGGPEGWFDPMTDENGNYTGELAFTIAPANGLGADYYRVFAIGTNGKSYGLDVKVTDSKLNFGSFYAWWGNNAAGPEISVDGNNAKINVTNPSTDPDNFWGYQVFLYPLQQLAVQGGKTYSVTATLTANRDHENAYFKLQQKNTNGEKFFTEKNFSVKANEPTPIRLQATAAETLDNLEFLFVPAYAPEGSTFEISDVKIIEEPVLNLHWTWANIESFERTINGNNVTIKANGIDKGNYWANAMSFWCNDNTWGMKKGQKATFAATVTNDAAEDFDIYIRVQQKDNDNVKIAEQTVYLKAGQPADISLSGIAADDYADLTLYLNIGNAPEGVTIGLNNMTFSGGADADFTNLVGGEYAYAQINADGNNPVSGTLRLCGLSPYTAVSHPGTADLTHEQASNLVRLYAVGFKNDGTVVDGAANSLFREQDIRFNLLPQENLGLDFSWWHGEFMEQTGSLNLYPKYAYTDAEGNWIYGRVLDSPVTVTHSIQSFINDNAGFSTDGRGGRGNGHSWWDADNSQWVHPYFDVRLADYWVKMETSGKLKRNARIRTGVKAKAVFVKVDPTVDVHNPEVDGYSTPAAGYGPYLGPDGKLLTDVNTSLNRAYKVLFSSVDHVKEGVVDDPGENFDQYYLRALAGTPLYNLLQSAGVGVRENNGESYIDMRFVSHGRGQGFYQVNLGRELRLSRDQEFQFVIDHDGNKTIAPNQFSISTADADRFNNTTSNVMMEANASGKSVIKQGIAFYRIILQVLPSARGGYSYSIYLAQKGNDGEVQLPYGFNSLTDAEVMPVPSLKVWVNDENSSEPENTSGIVRLADGKPVASADNSGFFEGLNLFDTDLNPGYMFSGNTAFIPFRPVFDGGIKDGKNYVLPGKVVKSGDRLTVEKPAEAARAADGWRQIPNLYYIDIPEGITLSPERIIDGSKKFTYPSYRNENGESPEFEFWQLPYQTWREQQAGDGNWAMRDDEMVVRDVFRQFNFFNIEGEDGLEAATPENGGQWFYANAWWCANPNIRDREGNLNQRYKPGTTGDLVIGQKMKVYGITLFRITGNRWNMYSNRTGDNKYDDGNLYYVYFNTLPGRGPELTCPILLDRFGDTEMEFDDNAEGVDMPEYFFPREVFYTDRYTTGADLTQGTDYNMPIVRNLLAKKLKYGGLNPNGDAEYVAILSNNAKAASRADDGKDAEGYYPQKDYNFRFIDVTSTQYWGGDNADVLLPSKYSYYYAGQRLAARFDVVAQSAKNGNTFTKIRDNHRFNIFGGRPEDAADTDHSGNILGGIVHTSSYPLLLELINNGENKDTFKDFYENEGSGYNVPGGMILGRTKVDYSRIVIATNYDNARFMIKANVPVMTAMSDKYTSPNPDSPEENVVYPVSTVTLQTPYSDSDLANLPEGERFFTVSIEISYKDADGNPDGSQKIEERFYVDYEKNDDGSYKRDEKGNLIMTGTARTRKPEGADDSWQPIVVNIQRFDEDNASEEIYLNHDENLVHVEIPFLVDANTVDKISATMSVGSGTSNPANDVTVNYSIPEADVTIDAEFVNYSDDGRTITADVDWTSPAINETMPDMPHNYTVWAWDEKERIDAGDPEVTEELFREIVESGNIPSYWHVVEVKTGNEHNTYPFEANYSLYDTSQDIDGVWSWKMDLRYGVQLEYIAAYPKRDDDPAKRGSKIVSAEAPDKDYSAVPDAYHADRYTAYSLAALPYQVQTGIDDAEAIEDGTPRYFDIQGYEVADPQSGRVYIRITTKGAVKVRF